MQGFSDKLDLSIDIGGVKFRNPIFMASGTFGYGDDLTDLVNYEKLGGIITKGVSVEPRLGNPTPRILETSSGMLNSIGLQNIGLEAFLRDKAPLYKTIKTKVIANIFGTSLDQFEKLASEMNGIEGLTGFEINISCPNVKEGGVEFGVDPKATSQVVKRVRSATKLPVIVKLTPNVTDPTLIAKAAVDAGADGLTVSNTLLGMRIDIVKRCPSLANTFGGLSGPAVLPVILRQVWQVAGVVKVPILASGGVFCAEDAIEYIMAGATGIQVGTATYVNPVAAHEILTGIEDFLTQNNFTLSRLVGAARA